jgi:iron complex outermembrane receptor protein
MSAYHVTSRTAAVAPSAFAIRIASGTGLAAGLLAATMLGGAARAATEADAPPAVEAAATASVGEVLVTARHRAEDPQKVPVALSVLGGELLAKTNTSNFAQVSQLVPSVQFSFYNSRNANINLRGLGNSIGLANDGLEPGVGFYVDGVYYDRPASATFDLIDIDRIEVARGPQGTLFGKNTTAGAISINTLEASFKPTATLEATGGDYSYAQAKASFSGALIGDVLAGRISVAATSREGLLTNVYNGNRINNYRNETLRGELLYKPNSDLKVRLIADYSRQPNNCCDLVLAGIVSPPNGKNFTNYAQAFGYTPVVDPYARQANTNANIQARQETGGLSVQTDYKTPNFVITSITAWRFWNWWPGNDSDYTPISVLNFAQNGDHQQQFSQELRIASAGIHAVDYVAGLYFFDETIHAGALSQFGNAASYFLLSPALPSVVLDGYTVAGAAQYDTKSAAAFGQAVWHVTPKLNLTGGLRYTYDDKWGYFNQTISGAAAVPPKLAPTAALFRSVFGVPLTYTTGTRKGDVSGQINLSYQLEPTVLVYANAATGNKSGGLNLAQLPAGASSVIRPEKVTSFEAGVKSRLFDRKLTFNADVFLEEDKDYQTNLINPTTLKQYLSNIPKVRTEGAEIDLNARPTDSLSLYLAAVYDFATYKSFPNSPAPLELITQPSVNLSGRPLAGTPRFSLSFGGEYFVPFVYAGRALEAFVGADDTYRSSVFSAANDSIYSRLPALNLVNARLGLRSSDGAWDAYVWSKNLTDKKYLTFVQAGVGNTGALFAQVGEPRTIGATLRYHF